MGESHDEKLSAVTLLSNVIVVDSAVSESTTKDRPGKYGVGSVEVSPSKSMGESGIRRLANSAKQLVQRPLEDINTVYDVVAYAALKYGDREALGCREIVKTVEEEREVTKAGDETEKKQWKYFELSEYKWMSYNQVKDAASEISRGLIKHGISTGDVFNIYALTSRNWQLVSQGCTSVSITIATSYDSVGESGLTQSLNEPECVGVFTNAELLPTLLSVLPKAPTVKLVVYDGKPETKLLEDIAAVRDTKVTSVDELRALGRAEPIAGLEERTPKKEDHALIIYTSGSTGDRQGVVLTHANLVASIGAVQTLIGHYWQPDDTYLAYLPLSHVLEFTIELIFFFAGVRIGYGNAKTLTDASVRNCKGDICTLAPSVMVGVPNFWETIRKGILTKANADGSFEKTKFHKAVWVKKNMPILSSLADKTVLSEIQAASGGRLRIAISTGAALSQETQKFLSAALVPVIQAYCITESAGMCAILPPELHRGGSVGLPIPSIEIKLLDVLHTRSSAIQQGEVCIRGPSVTPGYFERPGMKLDKTGFIEDGWLRTGDIGQWNPDGTLSLIDRLKNVVKMDRDLKESIALGRLEATYRACKLVHNICVYAPQGAKQPLAIVVPHPQLLRNYLVKRGSSNSNRELAILCRDHNIREIVRKECDVIGRKNGFRELELLQAVILTPDEWTPENGLVTAMQQIRRDKIAEAFKSQIEEVYKM